MSATWKMLLCLAVLPLVCSAYGDNCPGPNAVQFKNNLYEFTYESWVVKKQGDTLYTFGRCVQNKKDADLFVDWKKTDVKGYAAAKDCLYAGIRAIASPVYDAVRIMGAELAVDN